MKTVSEVNTRLIYCSLTGYGQTGPMASEAGHDINYIAISGYWAPWVLSTNRLCRRSILLPILRAAVCCPERHFVSTL